MTAHNYTHIKGNTLDLIITNSYNFISNVLIDKTGKFSLNSDHYPVIFSYASTPLPSFYSTPIWTFDYPKPTWKISVHEFLLEDDYVY